MDKKGAFTFIFVTLGISFVADAIVIKVPTLYWLAYVLLLAPALGALAGKLISRDADVPKSSILGAPRGKVVRMAIVIPLLFALTNLLTTLFKTSRPDWRFGELMAQLPPPSQYQLPAGFVPFYPMTMFLLGMVLCIAAGPTLYALAVLATEYGWRGYLLPRLMPLGRWRAYIISGLLWGLSVAPFAVRKANNQHIARILVILVFTIVLSALLGEIWRKSKHIGLTSACLGIILCQGWTIWPYMFPPGTSIWFPWAGPTGLVGSGILLIAVFAIDILFGRLEPLSTPPKENPIQAEPVPQA